VSIGGRRHLRLDVSAEEVTRVQQLLNHFSILFFQKKNLTFIFIYLF
jgi:hypothetical protein